jgi:antitoxin component of MazEF toxin-antitoxin module
MTCAATLRQSGGSIILTIPKSIAQTMAVEAGSLVELAVEGRKLLVTPARRSLADRLVVSPKSPAAWPRDGDAMKEGALGDRYEPWDPEA